MDEIQGIGFFGCPVIWAPAAADARAKNLQILLVSSRENTSLKTLRAQCNYTVVNPCRCNLAL